MAWEGTRLAVSVSKTDIARATESIGHASKVLKARDRMNRDAKETFGARHAPDGTYTVNVDLTKGNNRHKLIEMRREYAAAQMERSATLTARTQTVALRAPTGEVRHIPAHVELQAAKSGFRPVVNWGKPTSIYRDGVWYRREGAGWVPE